MVQEVWALPKELFKVLEEPFEESDFIRGLCKEERKIKVANGVEAEVEAIGDLSLELDDGFRLQLSDIFYVPSLHKNLISVSRLDDDGYDCHFGNIKCWIVINNKCVGLAFR